MQINSTTNTAAYTTTVKETSKTQEIQTTEEKKFDMTQPFDIDSFTFEDYKAIEGKDLKAWIDNNSDLTKEQKNRAHELDQVATLTDDNTLNKLLFNKANESFEETGESLFGALFLFVGFMEPLEIRHNNTDNESLKNDSKNQSISSNTEKICTAENILNNMGSFPEVYEEIQQTANNQISISDNTFQLFDEILAEYTKLKDEQNAALDAYTRNTKQNPISV